MATFCDFCYGKSVKTKHDLKNMRELQWQILKGAQITSYYLDKKFCRVKLHMAAATPLQQASKVSTISVNIGATL